MIDLPLMLAFIAAASLLTVTPGVDTAIVLRTATLEGRRQAVLAAAGICLGCLAWGVAVSLGLGALLQASELAYTLVKFAGAAYLIWLGSHLLFKPRASFDAGTLEAPSAASGQAFWRGLLTNLLNPEGHVLRHLPAPVRPARRGCGRLFVLPGQPACTAEPGLVRRPDRGNDPARQAAAPSRADPGAGPVDRWSAGGVRGEAGGFERTVGSAKRSASALWRLENGLGNATSRCTAPSNWCV